jgi:glycine cleavage system H protein
MSFPENLLYTEEHEWASVDDDKKIATIGITDFAQSELGDIVFLELPGVGDTVKEGKTIGSIEAVKTVADLYSPVSGTIAEVNESLEDEPELINEDPYDKGWIVKIEMSDPSELDALLSVEKYKKIAK